MFGVVSLFLCLCLRSTNATSNTTWDVAISSTSPRGGGVRCLNGPKYATGLIWTFHLQFHIRPKGTNSMSQIIRGGRLAFRDSSSVGLYFSWSDTSTSSLAHGYTSKGNQMTLELGGRSFRLCFRIVRANSTTNFLCRLWNAAYNCTNPQSEIQLVGDFLSCPKWNTIHSFKPNTNFWFENETMKITPTKHLCFPNYGSFPQSTAMVFKFQVPIFSSRDMSATSPRVFFGFMDMMFWSNNGWYMNFSVGGYFPGSPAWRGLIQNNEYYSLPRDMGKTYYVVNGFTFRPRYVITDYHWIGKLSTMSYSFTIQFHHQNRLIGTMKTPRLNCTPTDLTAQFISSSRPRNGIRPNLKFPINSVHPLQTWALSRSDGTISENIQKQPPDYASCTNQNAAKWEFRLPINVYVRNNTNHSFVQIDNVGDFVGIISVKENDKWILECRWAFFQPCWIVDGNKVVSSKEFTANKRVPVLVKVLKPVSYNKNVSFDVAIQLGVEYRHVFGNAFYAAINGWITNAAFAPFDLGRIELNATPTACMGVFNLFLVYSWCSLLILAVTCTCCYFQNPVMFCQKKWKMCRNKCCPKYGSTMRSSDLAMGFLSQDANSQSTIVWPTNRSNKSSEYSERTLQKYVGGNEIDHMCQWISQFIVAFSFFVSVPAVFLVLMMFDGSACANMRIGILTAFIYFLGALVVLHILFLIYVAVQIRLGNKPRAKTCQDPFCLMIWTIGGLYQMIFLVQIILLLIFVLLARQRLFRLCRCASDRETECTMGHHVTRYFIAIVVQVYVVVEGWQKVSQRLFNKRSADAYLEVYNSIDISQINRLKSIVKNIKTQIPRPEKTCWQRVLQCTSYIGLGSWFDRCCMHEKEKTVTMWEWLLQANETYDPFVQWFEQSKVEMHAIDDPHLTRCGKKNLERAIYKSFYYYGRKYYKLQDLVRGTFVFETFEELVDAMEALSNDDRIKIIRIKNRFDPDEKIQKVINSNGGYRDCAMNIVMKTDENLPEFPCEVQCNIRSVMELKSVGHVAYEYVRVINKS